MNLFGSQIFHTLNYIELLSILLQKYNPVVTKTDIGGEKMKRED